MLSKLYFSVQGGTQKKKEKEKGLGDDDDDDDKLGCFQKDSSQVPKLELSHTCNLKKPKIAPLI
jgi:hypothetical protein